MFGMALWFAWQAVRENARHAALELAEHAA
jgi:hypothetical protein